jgi:hypothetical protein
MTKRIYGFKIRAYWERRAETPEALAERFVRTVDQLEEIDPVFALWTCGSKRPKRFETMRDRYAEEVAEGLTRDDWGDPEPINGYWFGALTRRVSVTMCKQVSVSLPFTGDSHGERNDNCTGTS